MGGASNVILVIRSLMVLLAWMIVGKSSGRHVPSVIAQDEHPVEDALESRYALSGPPETYFVDRRGWPLAHVTGPVDEFDDLEARVAAALAP